MRPFREDHKVSVVDGVTIRSALEARWATFFSHFGLKWEYEPIPFRLRDGHTYTPDFKVENLGWIEIKPTVGHLKESIRKIKQFLSEHSRGDLYALCSDRPRLRYGEIVLFSDKIYLPTENQMAAKLTKARGDKLKLIANDAITAAMNVANAIKIDHMVRVVDHFRFNSDKISPVPIVCQ